MKKGKWNYTEDITYRVILVKILAMPKTPMHWQNNHVGEERQALEIHARDNSNIFYIDNKDGSGLNKIARAGGPDSYSAHLGAFEFIKVMPEEDWKQWDIELHKQEIDGDDNWRKDAFPEEYKKLESLRSLITQPRGSAKK